MDIGITSIMTRPFGQQSTRLPVIGPQPLGRGRRALFRIRISGPPKQMTVSQIRPLPVGAKGVTAMLSGLAESVAITN